MSLELIQHFICSGCRESTDFKTGGVVFSKHKNIGKVEARVCKPMPDYFMSDVTDLACSPACATKVFSRFLSELN